MTRSVFPKPQAVAEHRDSQGGLETSALGLLQSRIHRQRSGFHRQRLLDGERGGMSHGW